MSHAVTSCTNQVMSNCFAVIRKSRTEKHKSNEKIVIRPFERIPAGVLLKTFRKLRVEDLKSARLVCQFWNTVISDTQLLSTQTSGVVFKGAESLRRLKGSCIISVGSKSIWAHLPPIAIKKYPIHGTTFRIEHSDYHHGSILFYWIYWFKIKNITVLELHNSVFPLNKLFSCISNHFKKLETLIFSGTILKEYRSTKPIKELKNSTFEHLKNLNIHTDHPWVYGNYHTPVQTQPIPQFLTTQKINCLVSLNIRMCDTGHPSIDRRGHFEEIFHSLSLIVRNNVKTLKKLSVVTYDLVNDRACKFFLTDSNVTYFDDSEIPNESDNFLFQCFLEEIKVSDWTNEGLKLEELTMTFRLIILKNDPSIEDTLKPFLKSLCGSLRQISVSQIYSHTRENFQDVFGYFFRICKCNFLEVSDILHSSLDHEEPAQGLLSYYSERTNPTTFFNQFEQMKVIFTKYPDVSTILETPNIRWVVRFCQWKSIFAVGFFKNNIEYLTKIRVNHGYHVAAHDKLIISDQDMQKIIKSAPLLKELSFEYCNLMKVTDYGLTGIPVYWKIDKHPEPHIIVATGLPLSHLKKLRSLRLGQVGRRITNISAKYAFNGLERIDFLRLDFVYTSTSRVKALDFKFPSIRSIERYPPTQQTHTYIKINV